MKKFFSKAEEDIIIQSIQKVESYCESEVRVHVDFADISISPIDAAIKAFNRLGMHRTKNRNAVLILLLPDRKEFAVIGDIAIHEKVGDAFWNNLHQIMRMYFEDSRFVQGTCEAIECIGLELIKYFPATSDHNELPDQISYA